MFAAVLLSAACASVAHYSPENRTSAVPAEDAPKELTPKQALQPFNVLVGTWKGSGYPARGHDGRGHEGVPGGGDEGGGGVRGRAEGPGVHRQRRHGVDDRDVQGQDVLRVLLRVPGRVPRQPGEVHQGVRGEAEGEE